MKTKQRGYIRGIDHVRIEIGAPVLVTINFECDGEEAQALLALANRAVRANKPVTLTLYEESAAEPYVYTWQWKTGDQPAALACGCKLRTETIGDLQRCVIQMCPEHYANEMIRT